MTAEVKEKKPILVNMSIRALASARCIQVVDIVSKIFLVISISVIAWNYCLLLAGNSFSDYQKMLVDYSIPVLAGSVLYQIKYAKDIEKMVGQIIGVKKIKTKNMITQ